MTILYKVYMTELYACQKNKYTWFDIAVDGGSARCDCGGVDLDFDGESARDKRGLLLKFLAISAFSIFDFIVSDKRKPLV